MTGIADVVNAFEGELGDVRVVVALGRKELVRHERPPRIVFVPVGGPVGSATEIGRRDIAGGSTRSIHERALKCEIFCWGRDFAETEQLLQNTVVALRRTALGTYDLGEENWQTETEEGQADLQYGDMVSLECVMHLPIVDAITPISTGAPVLIPLATPSALEHVGFFANTPFYGWAGLSFGSGQLYGGGRAQVC